MRKRIEKIIKSVGLDINDFIIGEGAQSDYSEVHFNPTFYDPDRDGHKKYSIQYSKEIVAIFEIEKRINKGGSLNLSYDGFCWRDIKGIHEKYIHIQGDWEDTKAAIMPIDFFEPYLRCTVSNEDGNDRVDKNEAKKEEEKYYLNRLEGGKVEIYTTRYERDPKLRKQAIAIHGTECFACGFSFEKKYGQIGEGFIEVHHIKPISQGMQKPDPDKDLVCLCSNCHSMVHRKRDRVIPIEELKALINNSKT